MYPSSLLFATLVTLSGLGTAEERDEAPATTERAAVAPAIEGAQGSSEPAQAPRLATVDVTAPPPGVIAAPDPVLEATPAFETPPRIEERRAAPPAKKPLRTWLAVQSDVGVPDGLGVSAVVTPFEWLRLHVGAVGNGANAGVRGGITLLPRLWVVRPTLTIDGGRIFPGDARPILGAVVPESVRPLLEGVAWDFASARLGIEVGTRRGAVQLQAGGSYVDVQMPGLAQVVQGLGSGTRIAGGMAHMTIWAPSVRVGLIVALF